MLKSQIEGNLDSWGIFWAINIIKNDGLCINPVDSRISNIGHDGTGVHCPKNRRYDVTLETKSYEKIIFPNNAQPDGRIVNRYKDFMSESFLKKVMRFCINKIK